MTTVSSRRCDARSREPAPFRVAVVADEGLASRVVGALEASSALVATDTVPDASGLVTVLEARIGEDAPPLDAVVVTVAEIEPETSRLRRVIERFDPDVVVVAVVEGDAARPGRSRTSDPSTPAVPLQRLEQLASVVEREAAGGALRRRQRRSVETLGRTSELLDTIVRAASPFGIGATDADGTVVLFNMAATEIFGIPAERVVGRPLEALFEPLGLGAPSSSSILEAIRVQGRHEADFRFVRPSDGESRGCRWVATRLTERGDTSPHIAFFVRDTTESIRDAERRADLEQQLRVSQKLEAVGRLAAGVAHDFNNLLLGILGYNELVKSGLGEGHALYGFAEETGKAAWRAATLTRQLLATSRMEIARPRVVDLHDLITEFSKMIRRVIGEDVDLESRLEATDPKVHVDPGQLEQVILNLVLNARDAMPDGGKLVVATRDVDFGGDTSEPLVDLEPGSFVALEVRDEGIGMDRDTLSRIFDPFYTTKERGKGTGLGLSTAYGIIQQNGGSIRVESEPRKGSTFFVYLPSPARVASPDAAGEAFAEVPGGHERILVVEDEPSVRDLVRRMLESRGYRVLSAVDGEDAVATVERERGRVDLMLTDVVMPKLSGPAAVARIVDRWPSIAVLYMSGYPDSSARELDPGIRQSLLLVKPFSGRELAARVREVLDGRGTTRSSGRGRGT